MLEKVRSTQTWHVIGAPESIPDVRWTNGFIDRNYGGRLASSVGPAHSNTRSEFPFHEKFPRGPYILPKSDRGISRFLKAPPRVRILAKFDGKFTSQLADHHPSSTVTASYHECFRLSHGRPPLQRNRSLGTIFTRRSDSTFRYIEHPIR